MDVCSHVTQHNGRISHDGINVKLVLTITKRRDIHLYFIQTVVLPSI